MRTNKLLLLLTAVAACSAPRQTAAPSASSPQSIDPALAHVRELLDAGQPRDALTELDDLARTAPADARVWLVRGEACMATALTDGEPNFYYLDALNAYERAVQLGAGREALLGASRAARLAVEPERALEYAHRAVEGVAQLDPQSARIAIEASFDCYIAKRNAQQDASELQVETQQRLFDMLAQQPDDLWALVTLANLFQWEGRDDAAVEPLAHLLDLQPSDENLHNRFVTVLRTAEGTDEVVAFYESFRERHPDTGLGEWYAAQELFEQALNELYAQQDSSAKFARAEQLLAACREIAPSYTESCQGFEVMCRNGIGWCRFNAGDFEAAERAFFSMEDVFAGGLQWQIQGRLLSGVQGVQLIADRALREGVSTTDAAPTGISKAAELYRRLHAACPNDATVANNCGFFHREVGVEHLQRQRNYVLALVGETVEDQKAAFAERAHGERLAAAEALTISRDAYLAAARLAPDDVRIVNDAALMLVYHFPSRADDAERLLLRAVELGREQKDDPQLADDARDALLEAWGDAHQNLGVLHLLHRQDSAAARGWFQKSFDIGPRPRVDRRWISDVALPLCAQVAPGSTVAPQQLDERIGYVE